MRQKSNIFFFLQLYFISLFYSVSFSQLKLPLNFEKRIVLEDVNNPIDYIDVDVKGQRIFATVSEKNTLLVIDINQGAVVSRIEKLNKPKAVIYVSSSNSFFVANGGDGSCIMFGSKHHEVLFSCILSKNADQFRYDAASRKIFVGHGNNSISVIDATNGKILSNFKLSGHAESFELDFKRNLIFANVPSKEQVEVIDYRNEETLYIWKLKGKKENYGMALDYLSSRLFIACLKPAEMLILGSWTGRVMTSLECSQKANDMIFDPLLRRVYVACGEGFIQVYQQTENDIWESSAKIPTKPGANIMRFAPVLNRIYLATPGKKEEPAEIYIYKISN